MGLKNYLLLMLAVISFPIYPLIAEADSITWIDQSYNVGARVRVLDSSGNPSYTSAGDSGLPPLHIFLQGTYSYDYAESWIHNENSFEVLSAGASTASASFSGNYTAILPILQLDYIMTDISGSLGFRVDDITTGTSLFNTTFGSLSHTTDTGIVQVNTLIGHEISVSTSGRGSGSFNVYYSSSTPVPVAPEPISSILFVTGGTLLAGRRYLRKKKKA
ncbi:MAG: hypothetical protein HY755_00265 [Nitrospirae bacterium]|nr:hypothetical protein [Nitrospirota bacterium]MBI4847116.1 hypothetical protein [Nitrospirota bacterium]